MKLDILKIQTYPISTDLLLGDTNMPNVARNVRQNTDWTMYFNPMEYLESHPGLSIAKCSLSYKKLTQYGRQITQLRD